MGKILSSARQWDILAALRFGLAWIVFCSHFKDFGAQEIPAIAFFVHFDGRAAVLGFLLVSGYSIAHSMQQKPQGFLWRRFLRLYPLYLAAILFTQVLSLQLGSQVELPTFTFHQTGVPTTLCNLVFLQTFACISLGYNPVVWSLAIEVFYYLLAPMLQRLNRPILFAIAISSGLVSIFLNAVIVDGTRTPSWIYFFGVTALTHIWAWIFGFLYFKNPRKSFGLFLIILGVLFIALNPHQFYGPFSVFTYEISFALIIYAESLGSCLSRSVSKVLAYLGNLSYPLYLFHLPLLLLGYSVLKLPNANGLLALTFLGSILFYHLVDVHLKQKYLVPLIYFLTQKEPLAAGPGAKK